MGVSKNLGTPKWMVYNGKTLLKWMIWGIPIFGNAHIYSYLQTSFQNFHRIGSPRYRNQATFVSHGLTFAEAYERTGRTGTVGWVGLRSGGFSRVGDC